MTDNHVEIARLLIEHGHMYNFAGWFTTARKGLRDRVTTTWPHAAVVDVTTPFRGLGLRAADPHPCIEADPSRYDREFRRPLTVLSSELPEQPFVYVEAECWGGDCVYIGEVYRAGEVVAHEKGASGDGALARLMAHLGAKLNDEEYFVPFERSFPWQTAG